MKKIFILCSVIMFVRIHAMGQDDSNWCTLQRYQSLLTTKVFSDIRDNSYNDYTRDSIRYLLLAADMLSGSGKSFSVWGSSHTPATPYYTPLQHRYMALKIFNFVIDSKEEYKEEQYKKWAAVGHVYVYANIYREKEEEEARKKIIEKMSIKYLLN